MAEMLSVENMDLFASGVRHFVQRQKGWTLEILKSLGLMDTSAKAPGNCLGCHMGHSLPWILHSLMSVGQGHKNAAFFDLTIETTPGSVEIADGGFMDDLEGVFVDNQDLIYALAPLSTPTHMMVAQFRREGSTITITVINSHAPSVRNSAIAEMVRKYMDEAPNRQFQYEIEEVKCLPGLHDMAESSAGGVRRGGADPAGYCHTYAAIAMICCLAVDGTDTKCVIDDLLRMFEGKAAGLLGLVSVVSASANKLFFEHFARLGHVCDSECCQGVSYCDQPQ
jgi:hypothetical protein